MMKRLTIDSSVIISSLLENESRHGEAMQIWDAVITGGDVAIMPYSVFVEVVAAIRRRTGSEELATEVKEELLKIENVSFVILDQRAAEDAADIAIQQLLDDIRSKVSDNIKKLEEYFQKITPQCFQIPELNDIIDLEGLRSLMESEIYSDIFQMTFDNEQVMNYIVDIKTLEEKLYENYNTIVMIYIRSI